MAERERAWTAKPDPGSDGCWLVLTRAGADWRAVAGDFGYECDAVLAAAAPSMRDALESCSAWLERWANHVGRCRGGADCTCGLTAMRAEVHAALAKAEPQTLSPQAQEDQ